MSFASYLDENRARIASQSYRYEFCDDTCTVDCGHCKGKGKPVDTKSSPIILTVNGVYVPKGK